MPEQRKSIQNSYTRSTRVEELIIEAYNGDARMSDVLAEMCRRLEALERRDTNGKGNAGPEA